MSQVLTKPTTILEAAAEVAKAKDVEDRAYRTLRAASTAWDAAQRKANEARRETELAAKQLYELAENFRG